jgi:hypothetical protein
VGGFDEALVEAKKLANIAPDAKVQLVDFPRPVSWWQELARKRNSDQVALQARIEYLEKVVTSGIVDTPGVVWMPPILIE